MNTQLAHTTANVTEYLSYGHAGHATPAWSSFPAPTIQQAAAYQQPTYQPKHPDDRRMALAWGLQNVLSEHPGATVRSRGDFDVVIDISRSKGRNDNTVGIVIAALLIAFITFGIGLLLLFALGSKKRDRSDLVHLMVDEFGNMHRLEHPPRRGRW